MDCGLTQRTAGRPVRRGPAGPAARGSPTRGRRLANRRLRGVSMLGSPAHRLYNPESTIDLGT